MSAARAVKSRSGSYRYLLKFEIRVKKTRRQEKEKVGLTAAQGKLRLNPEKIYLKAYFFRTHPIGMRQIRYKLCLMHSLYLVISRNPGGGQGAECLGTSLNAHIVVGGDCEQGTEGFRNLTLGKKGAG